MRILRNIRKTLVGGQAFHNGPDYLACADAVPSTSYILSTGYYNSIHAPETIANCSGIILNARGYDMFELNVWAWRDADVNVYESDDREDLIQPPIYTINFQNGISFPSPPFLIPITKGFIKIASVLYPSYEGGDVVMYQPSIVRALSISVKTPQKYPVYDAAVNIIDADDNEVINTVNTDANGNAAFSIDTVEHEKVKIWAEKTINKSLHGLTAKEISELLEVNADR